jgi:hypothetical protein
LSFLVHYAYQLNHWLTLKASPVPTAAARLRPVDVASRESRSRLAAMVMRLFDHWNLSATEQAELLGLSAGSRSTLARYRNGEPHDRDLAYRWMTQPNRRLGARPVDVVIEHGFEGLLAVRRYLDFQRGQ